MTRIVIDDVLRDKLIGLMETVELCDASGRVLGRMLPSFNREDYENLSPPISEEELKRRLNSTPSRTYTTEEGLRHLESL